MYSINYGDEKIEFEVKRKNVKNINLTVKRNLDVCISANKRVPINYIKEFVRSKADWIKKHLNYYKSIEKEDEEDKQYVNGELLRYLGKQYRLKVFECSKESVKYFRGFIHIYVDNLEDVSKKEQLINSWYREKSKTIFKESLKKMHKLMKPYDIAFPELKTRKMKARWGTCYYKSNKIIINSILVKASKDCIDYVVLHELIHFIHYKHNRDFYSLLTILMPDWKDKKKILDEVVAREL